MAYSLSSEPLGKTTALINKQLLIIYYGFYVVWSVFHVITHWALSLSTVSLLEETEACEIKRVSLVLHDQEWSEAELEPKTSDS